jgi:coenzyme F420-reducing hydrogenase alpha subunit
MREERELEEDKAEHSQRKLEEVGTLAENMLSLLAGRRRRMTTSLTKRRLTSKAKADVEESLEMIDQYKDEIEDLVEERQEELDEVEEKWQEIVEEVSEIPVTPYKKDILIELFGVGWFPFYSYNEGGKQIELGAFSINK